MEDKNKKDRRRYICGNCKRIFSTKNSLKQHYQTHLDKDLRDTFCCYHCEKKFYSKAGIINHLSICDKNNQNSNSKAQVHHKVKCAMCVYEDSQINVLKHYNEHHDIEIFTECIKFNNFKEFEKWKDETEKTNISKYVRYDSRKSAIKTHFYYRCHRDGVYKNFGKNIRLLKMKGSNKINGFCPSKLTVTVENANGHVSVKFVKTHVGHEMDIGKIPLGKSERNILASMISLQMPFDEILNSVRDDVNETTIERLHLLTRKDLYNIKQLYKNKSLGHSDDCVNVQAWIKEMQESSCESVIRFYKRQGEDNKSMYSELQKEDFLLIIMNDAQMEILEKHGNDCICIDTTHGLNEYNIELTTLMVLDDLRQGFPCLFMFSNRSDTDIFKIFFKVLKNVLDFPLTPTVFMSDMAENCYNAWTDVMGPVHFRLFSSWHVLRAWKNVYSKIKNTEKQSSVQNFLKSLLEELNENAFEQMFCNFIQSTETDVQLKKIGQYLKTNFYSNRKSWAYCHRKHTGLNINIHLEQMHCTLKYIYVQGKTANRLDQAINDIMTLVRDKLYDRLIIILHKGKVSTKLSALKKRHENMEQMKYKPIIEEQDGNWILSSATGRELWKIQMANPSCKCEVKCMKCDTCIHGYTCSCPDSSVKWNMCQHIHLLCQSGFFLTNSRPNVPIETETALMQLTSTVTDKYKDKLWEKFQSILTLATTMEQCSVIDKALAPLATTLVTMEPPHVDGSPISTGQQIRQIIEPPPLVPIRKCGTKITNIVIKQPSTDAKNKLAFKN